MYHTSSRAQKASKEKHLAGDRHALQQAHSPLLAPGTASQVSQRLGSMAAGKPGVSAGMNIGPGCSVMADASPCRAARVRAVQPIAGVPLLHSSCLLSSCHARRWPSSLSSYAPASQRPSMAASSGPGPLSATAGSQPQSLQSRPPRPAARQSAPSMPINGLKRQLADHTRAGTSGEAVYQWAKGPAGVWGLVGYLGRQVVQQFGA